MPRKKGGQSKRGRRNKNNRARRRKPFFFSTQRPGPEPANPVQETIKGWNVYFSPNGGIENVICEALRGSRMSVYVQTYVFTSPGITQALLEAHSRGVHVQVIVDSIGRGTKNSTISRLIKAGIPVHSDHEHNTHHNKVLIIDEYLVVTGSYNFTIAAEKRNAENCLVISDSKLAATYLENWVYHQGHSTLMKR